MGQKDLESGTSVCLSLPIVAGGGTMVGGQ